MTEKHFGPTYRQFRDLKGYSLTATAEGIMSVASLRKFETGKQDTTFSKFLKLLNRIRVTWSEFMEIHDGINMDIFSDYILRLRHYFYTGNLYEAYLMLETICQRFDHVPEIGFYLDIAKECLRLNFRNIPKKSCPKHLDKLLEYLQQVKEWGNFEAFLLLCVCRCMSLSQLEDVQERVITMIKTEQGDVFLNSCLIVAILDVTFKQLRSPEWVKIESLLEAFKPVLYQENNFLLITEVLFLRFQDSLYQIKSGNAMAKTDLLKIFDMVGHPHFSPKVYPNWFEQYGKICYSSKE